MRPVVIIPTYIAADTQKRTASIAHRFNHATPFGSEGTLPRCLESLTQVTGIGQIIVLVAADESVAEQAAMDVYRQVQAFPSLHVAVIGVEEMRLVHQRMGQLNLGAITGDVCFGEYGSIRNLGLVLAHVLGFDSVVFVDDSEVVDDPAFLEKAMYGLGKMTRNDIPILAKTGFYYNEKGSYLASADGAWHNRHWQQAELYNQWIERAIAGKRISRTNRVCGGCMALHKEAFKRVAFDPFIPRGEDLDYMLNLRMYGSDIWFDNQWSLRYLGDKTTNEGLRFCQDVYRWLYEFRKLEFSRAEIDLMQIKPASLQPYPGPFLEADIDKRLKKTARLRSLVRPNKAEYRQAIVAAKGAAADYATRNCGKYFDLQRAWPELMARMEGDAILRNALIESATRRALQAGMVPAAMRQEAARVQAVPAQAIPAQAAAEPDFDAGKTSEIRLNIQEE